MCALHIKWSTPVIHTELLWRGEIWQKLSNVEKMLRAQVICQQNTHTENQNVVTMCYLKNIFKNLIKIENIENIWYFRTKISDIYPTYINDIYQWYISAIYIKPTPNVCYLYMPTEGFTCHFMCIIDRNYSVPCIWLLWLSRKLAEMKFMRPFLTNQCARTESSASKPVLTHSYSCCVYRTILLPYDCM